MKRAYVLLAVTWLFLAGIVKYTLQQLFGAIVTEFVSEKLAPLLGVDKANVVATLSQYAVPLILAGIATWIIYKVGFREGRATPDSSGGDVTSTPSGTINNRVELKVQITGKLEEFSRTQAAIDAHETELGRRPDTIEVVKMVREQYQKLQNASAMFARMTGDAAAKEEFGARLLADLDLVLLNANVTATPQGDSLRLNTGPNTFRVLFAVAMRAPPNLTFYNLPSGVTEKVVELSEIGFTVIFVPQTTPVSTFDWAADAEI
jgi:hypothetical protein